jgi:hypothetical protein
VKLKQSIPQAAGIFMEYLAALATAAIFAFIGTWNELLFALFFFQNREINDSSRLAAIHRNLWNQLVCGPGIDFGDNYPEHHFLRIFTKQNHRRHDCRGGKKLSIRLKQNINRFQIYP